MALSRACLLAAGVLAATTGWAFADASGVWQSEKKDGKYIHVEIALCDGSESILCGTIVGAFGGASEANVGKPIIWDMEPDGENAWSGGRIWAPDEDETYRSEMELSGDILTVSGCVLGGLICRGQDWTRVR
ncbi:MAG: DUF2147 domain-containing protein [Pseudomonadota bacterium]